MTRVRRQRAARPAEQPTDLSVPPPTHITADPHSKGTPT